MSDEWLYILLGSLVGGLVGMTFYFTVVFTEEGIHKIIKTSEPIKIKKSIYKCEKVDYDK